jgi:hypothetical protein
MIRPLVDRTMEPLKKALSDAKKQPGDIDEIVLVGGSTRIPLVQETVSKYFGKEPHRGVNPSDDACSAVEEPCGDAASCPAPIAAPAPNAAFCISFLRLIVMNASLYEIRDGL